MWKWKAHLKKEDAGESLKNRCMAANFCSWFELHLMHYVLTFHQVRFIDYCVQSLPQYVAHSRRFINVFNLSNGPLPPRKMQTTAR